MNKSTLIERLRTCVAEFPIIAEHPSNLMTEAADRLEEAEAAIQRMRELPDEVFERAKHFTTEEATWNYLWSLATRIQALLEKQE